MGLRAIRNLDDGLYRELKARAVLLNRPIGELLGDAIRAYLARPSPSVHSLSLADLKPERFPKGNDRLSEEVDKIVYGVRSPKR